jgi:hypothetical protein
MRCTGVAIICCFAAIWWGVGVASGGYGTVPWFAVGVAISLGCIAGAVRRDLAAPRARRAATHRGLATVGVASAAEGVAMLVTVNVLNWLGLPSYALCGIAVIVGLHFVPLARALPYGGVYHYTAAALVAVGLAGCLLPETGRNLFVGVGAACVIWATCLPVIASPRRPTMA